jgi:two-component system LytT family response regulator
LRYISLLQQLAIDEYLKIAALTAVIAVPQPSTRKAIMQVLTNDPSIRLVRECTTGALARQAIAEEEPNLLFVEAELPDISGFDLVQTSGKVPAVVFIGRLGHHAARAFEVRAVDYIVRPVSLHRLEEALERAKLRVLTGMRDSFTRNDRPAQSQPKAEEPEVASGFLERMMLKSGNSRIVQKIHVVECFTAAANYVFVHVNSDTFRIRATMNQLEKRLNPQQFIRVHRSAIINLDFVTEFRMRRTGDYVITVNGARELNMSRNYSRQFLDMLSALKFEPQ